MPDELAAASYFACRVCPACTLACRHASLNRCHMGLPRSRAFPLVLSLGCFIVPSSGPRRAHEMAIVEDEWKKTGEAQEGRAQTQWRGRDPPASPPVPGTIRSNVRAATTTGATGVRRTFYLQRKMCATFAGPWPQPHS